MKRRIFLVCLFYCFFLDCRSTNLLRLFSGNLPAMFSKFDRVNLKREILPVKQKLFSQSAQKKAKRCKESVIIFSAFH